MTEDCGICGETVPFDATVHAMVHTRSEAGVVEAYVCRQCYDEHLGPMFERLTEREPSA
ncbi:hypothetical protein [Haloarcula salina]|uniref:Uncharacterized protein n=1 Tax=Haloarcula salina TaxID=1429914 RepID=A0AA41FZ65_9EURY|nr:hypothetical protein [Haloarcula salina]MBV0900348.1 hypothetical protein [Haloarcula salina]